MEGTNRSDSVAVARPLRAALARILEADVLAIAALRSPLTLQVSAARSRRGRSSRWLNTSERKGYQRARMIMHPNTDLPYFYPVTFFYDEETDRVRGKAVIPNPENLSDKIEVDVVPLIPFDGLGNRLPYVDFKNFVDKEGNIRMTGDSRTHHCLFFYSEHRRFEVQALPLALASADSIDRWNNLAIERIRQGGSEKDWFLLERIEHNLLAEQGTRTVRMRPEGLWKFPSKEGDERTSFHYGRIYGEYLVCEGNSAPIDFLSEDKDQDPTREQFIGSYAEESVFDFRVTVHEHSHALRYIGHRDEGKVVHGVPDWGTGYQVNGLEILGVDLRTVNMATFARRSYAFAKGPYDEANPVIRHLLLSHVIDNNTPDTEIYKRADQLVRTAIDSVRDLYDETIKLETDRLTSASGAPSMEEILEGAEYKDVWYREGGEDMLVDWINENQGVDKNEFDWESDIHRVVRRQLLAALAKRSGMDIPRLSFTARKEIKESQKVGQPEIEQPAQEEPQTNGTAAVAESSGLDQEMTDIDPKDLLEATVEEASEEEEKILHELPVQ